MKKLTYAFIAFLITALTVSACKSDSDEIVYTSNCYIKSFVLGAMKRTMHTTSITGADSVYYTSVSGSQFKISIDHLNGVITNVEPLPTGTRIDAVLTTITAQGGVYYASSTDTTSWTTYSASDSLDFTSPIIFRVLANDGGSYRDYRAYLTIRDADADSYTWTQVASVAALAQRKALKFVGLNTLLSTDAEGACHVAKGQWQPNSMPNTLTWADTPCTGLSQPDIQSAGSFDGKYWMSSTDGRLFSSEDAVAWSQVTQDGEGTVVRLFTTSPTALYAIVSDETGDNECVAASIDGLAWTPMETEGQLFTSPAATLAYKQANGNNRVLVAADVTADDDAPLYVWSLLEGHDQPWALFTEPDANPYLLPRMDALNLVSYNGYVIAIGADVSYISYDNGITWKEYTNLVLPTSIQGTAAPMTVCTAGEYIFVAAGSQIWRAHLNSYGE